MSGIEAYDLGREDGIAEERARIIKVLEEMQETALATETNEGSKTAWVLENAIALIKGKTNG
jgi:hypothetical protein